MYTSDDEREPCPELKNCPLCGEPVKAFYYILPDNGEHWGWGAECLNEKCPMYECDSIKVDVWNNRPLEDHLQNELKQTKYLLTLANEELSDLVTLNAKLEDEKNQMCNWYYDDDGGYCDSWKGTCGVDFIFGDGGPVENGVKFCPECGKRVNVIINEETNSNEETEEEE